MRARNQVNGISVHAISGTRAVLLAMDATPEARRRLLGFAIKVRRRAEATEHWLHGFKFFRELTPSSQPGGRRSTLEHPIQSFLWGHYSVEPDQGYEYTIRPVLRPDSGNLSQLEFGRDVTVTIRTQGVNQGVYSVFFNRGALVSQTYASRFGNHPLPPHPDDPEDAATVWLSRDLLRAVLDFIEQARNARFSLRAAVHEFSYVPVLNAFSEAAARGADVRIIYAAGSERKAGGAISLTSTARVNEAAIEQLSFDRSLLIPRTQCPDIPHNKFVILLENDHAVAVWTGSTNFTRAGFLGQTNVGHIVRDESVARAFPDYWQKLSTDPDDEIIKDWVMANNPHPRGSMAPNAIVPIFSPRRNTRMMNWYGEHLEAANQMVLLTAPFGVTRRLAEYLDNNRDFLRCLLIERQA